MTRYGHVEIANDRLSARCNACHKSIAWMGQRLSAWSEKLSEFRKKHKECGKGKAE